MVMTEVTPGSRARSIERKTTVEKTSINGQNRYEKVKQVNFYSTMKKLIVKAAKWYFMTTAEMY